MPQERLWAHHLADLQASGLSQESIDQSGCYSAPEPTTRILLGFGVGPGLVFPFPGCTSSFNQPFCQVKPDKRQEWMKHAKYLTPKDSGCHVYKPPTLEQSRLENTAVPIYLTEGCKKALKAVQEGLACLAFAGVDAWRDRSNGHKSAPLSDLDGIPWKRRKVYIVYDSDLAWKAPVRMAEFRLSRELQARGAIVHAIRLPNTPDGKKVGLDDYLLTHSIDTFCGLEPEIIEHPDKPGSIVQFSSVPLGDFVDSDLGEIPHLIGDGVITQSSLVSIVGRAKLGKTWILTQLGLTVAGLNTHWLSPDLPVVQSGRVMYINAEVAEIVFQKRLRLMLDHAGRAGGNVTLARRNFFPVSVRGQLKIDRKDGEAQILKLCEKIKPIMVILDPIGPLHNLDENSSEEMGKLLNSLMTICAKANTCVVFAHHASKNTENREQIHLGRGSSVFGDRVDSALTLVPTGDQTQGSRLRLAFTLRSGPARDSLILTRGVDEVLYQASSQTDDIVKWMYGIVREEERIERTVLKEKFTEQGFQGEFYFKSALKRLVTSGSVLCEKVGYPAKTVVYLSQQ